MSASNDRGPRWIVLVDGEERCRCATLSMAESYLIHEGLHGSKAQVVNTEATARLLTAAPAMKEALECAANELSNHCYGGTCEGPGGLIECSACCAIGDIKEALAQATEEAGS